MRVRSAVLVLSVFALPSQLLGQKAAAAAATTWGPWAAVNMTTFGGDDVSDADNRTAFGFGVQLQHSLGNATFFGSGLHYAMRGAKTTDQGITGTFKLSYVEVPILLGYRFPTSGQVRPYLMGGGHIGVKVGCSLEASQGSQSASISCEDAGAEVKSTDFALQGGAGLNFGLGANTLSVDLRYAYGLQNLQEGAEMKNRGFTLGVGYMLPLGR
jgi:outer membrane protein with beta-barrel domain